MVWRRQPAALVTWSAELMVVSHGAQRYEVPVGIAVEVCNGWA